MISPILFDDTESDSSQDLSLSSLNNSTISLSSHVSDSFNSTMSSTSTRSTRSQAPSSGPNSQSSNSSTEDYDIPQILVNNHAVANHDEDDDVVLIPQEIETIDLCTQAATPVVVPINLHNEIIDITDSPVPIATTRPRTRLSGSREATVAPARAPRGGSRTSPYARPTTSRNANTSTPKQVPVPPKNIRPLDFDDSFQSQANAIKYSCPICLESVKNREPVSTMCGHVFCKACIKAALQLAKKCPMCKKNLNAKNPFIQIFID